jgi:DNA repair photolyase
VYRELPCRSVLNRCDSPNVPFEWTINPYRGCEFGCRYCYARYTHEYIGLDDARLFETEIFAKLGAAEALERDLPPGRPVRGSIAIGTATDPYQPAERRLLVTRRILEVLARRSGLSLSITTKSNLVLRDLDLLAEIGRRHRLTVNVTVTTLSRRLARLLEPRAPRPELRLEAVRDLASAGIVTGVFIMPVLPGITDAPASLEAVVAAAAGAGAAYLAHQALFLRSSAKAEFYPLLDASFPRLSARYRRIYGASAYHTAEYRRGLDDLVSRLRERHGLASRPGPWPASEAGPQMSLGF